MFRPTAILFSLLMFLPAVADTPASSTVKAKVYSGDGVTSIGAVGDALKVTNTGSGGTVNQGTAGLFSWLVNITNASLAVTGPLTDTQLRASAVPISLAVVPLPTGAATSSLQTTGNGFLSSIDGKITTTVNGIKVDGSSVTQPVSVATLPLPSGASTSALQTSGNASLTSIDLKTPALVSGRVPVDGSGVTQPVSGPLTDVQLRASPVPVSLTSTTITGTVAATQSGVWSTGRTWTLASGTDGVAASQSGSWTVTANAGTNLNTSALALDTSVTGLQVSQGSTTLGQNGGLTLGAVTAGSPSYTTAQTSPLSLTTSGALRTDSSAVTQPISAASLPLPAGAATEATLSTLNGKVPSGLTVTSTRLLTDGSGVTQPISAASLPLPTGAATLAEQQTQTASLSVLDDWDESDRAMVNTIVGQAGVQGASGTVSANTQRVVLATDVALPTGTNSIGQVTANAGTNLNTSALALESGGNLAAINTNTNSLKLAQGSTTSGQTGPLIQAAVTTASPTYTTAQTNPLSLDTAGNLRVLPNGNVASGVADAGNPLKVGYVFNSTAPSPATGQRVDAQANSKGSLSVSPESRVKSYSAANTTLVVAALPTDVCTITGAASTLVKIRKITIMGEASANSIPEFAILKRSTANSGGTSSTLTAVPHESTDAAAVATVRTYTANPTTGTLVGFVRAGRIFLPGTAGNPPQTYDFSFSEGNAKPIVLNSASEVLSVSFLGITTAGLNLTCIFEWTEE